jgi:hypothetical protein
MFLPSIIKKRNLPAREERDGDNGNRDLVALVNEARTSHDLQNAMQIARMRRTS